ncbi:MAG: hypothetical protein ACO1SX_04330 [Actinomycetota bacterium]
MPIISEDSSRSAGTRSRRWIYLLLIPPVAVLLLALSSAFRPLELQLGPMVLVVMAEPDMGESLWAVDGSPVTPAWSPLTVGSHQYVVTGPGHTSYFQRHRWAYGFIWFRGHMRQAEGGE